MFSRSTLLCTLCIIFCEVYHSKEASQSFFSVDKVTIEDTDTTKADERRQSVIKKHHEALDKTDVDTRDDINSLVASMSEEKNGKTYKPSGLHLENGAQEDSGVVLDDDEDDDDDDNDDNNVVKEGSIRKRNFADTAKRWPKSIIPYKIHIGYNTEVQHLIHKSASAISELTCVKWVNLTADVAAKVGHHTHVFIRQWDGACWATIGFRNVKKTKLNLGPNCLLPRIVLHEMFHTMGIYHEQARSDRDDFITVHLDRAKEDFRDQFVKKETKNNHPYDFESIMQYRANSFSKTGLDVFELKDDKLSFLIKSRNTMSFFDVSDVLSAYNCAGHCNQRTSPICKYGVLNHMCECYCMDGFSGRSCDTLVTDSDCGGHITISKDMKEKVIKSPNYPNKYPTGKVCRWLISGKDGWYPQITIDDFHLSNNDELHRCYHWLEIQYNLPGQTGIRKCGEISEEVWNASPYSNGTMILTFDSAYVADQPAQRGFTISVRAVGKECFMDPCIHGECTTETPDSNAICKCDPGFSGTFCEIQVNKKAAFRCTFEQPKCVFHNTDENDDFQWTHGQGPGYNEATGPSGPYKGSHYLLADMPANGVPAGEKARLVTMTNFREVDRCFRFYHNMHSHNLGTLNVYMEGTTVQFKKIWSLSGDQGDVWKEVVVDIPSTPGLKLTIEAVRGNEWESQIAIDELSLFYGKCHCLIEPCINGECIKDRPESEAACKCDPGFSGPLCENQINKEASIECTFETDKCSFRNRNTTDSIQWIRSKGPGLNYYTGPSGPYRGKHYLLANFQSNGKSSGKKARFMTKTNFQVVDRCLKFQYNMHGHAIGSLIVYMKGRNKRPRVIWVKSGNQGKEWKEASVDIPPTPGLKLMIDAIRGNKWESQIAIDELSLSYGKCKNK